MSVTAPTTIPDRIEIEDKGDGTVTVWPIWNGVDRPKGCGMGIRANDKALIGRYVAALRAGVVYSSAKVRTDVNGETYVSTTSKVLGRYLNADLRRLGF